MRLGDYRELKNKTEELLQGLRLMAETANPMDLNYLLDAYREGNAMLDSIKALGSELGYENDAN